MEPDTGQVSPNPYGHAWHGRTDEDSRMDLQRGGFREYYRIGIQSEDDGADVEPTEKERELTEVYEPPHSPFGQIYTLISQGAFTYGDVMSRIPWCVILMMISDIGRTRKKQEEDNIIQTEEEELEFLGLK